MYKYEIFSRMAKSSANIRAQHNIVSTAHFFIIVDLDFPTFRTDRPPTKYISFIKLLSRFFFERIRYGIDQRVRSSSVSPSLFLSLSLAHTFSPNLFKSIEYISTRSKYYHHIYRVLYVWASNIRRYWPEGEATLAKRLWQHRVWHRRRKRRQENKRTYFHRYQQWAVVTMIFLSGWSKSNDERNMTSE